MALPDNLDQVQTTAVVGAFVPLVAAVFRQNRFSARANSLVVVAVTAVLSVVTTALTSELTASNVVVGFVVMYTAAVAFYHGLWQPTGVAPALQTRTSSRRRYYPAAVPVVRRSTPRSDLSRC